MGWAEGLGCPSTPVDPTRGPQGPGHAGLGAGGGHRVAPPARVRRVLPAGRASAIFLLGFYSSKSPSHSDPSRPTPPTFSFPLGRHAWTGLCGAGRLTSLSPPRVRGALGPALRRTAARKRPGCFRCAPRYSFLQTGAAWRCVARRGGHPCLPGSALFLIPLRYSTVARRALRGLALCQIRPARCAHPSG